MSTADATHQLAAFASKTRFGDLRPAARKLALDLLIDAVGVGLAGSESAEYQPLVDYSRRNTGAGSVPAPGGLFRDAGQAASLYGAAIHILDYDDILPEMGHSSSIVVSSALAVGYASGASGSAVLAGIAVGAEIGARIGAAANPYLYQSGWHPTAVIGAVASAGTAAAILGLNEKQTANAMGLAGAMASGMKASLGSTAKGVQVGGGARSGVEAALMAQAGVTGNTALLDPQYAAYFELFSPEAKRELLTQDLGSQSEFVRQGVRIKFLPCCGSIHSPVFAMLDVMADNKLEAASIVSIDTEVDPMRLPHTDRPVVQNSLAGKFSMQYCQAVAALTGRLLVSDFTDEAVLEPERQELMKKITLHPTEMPAGTGPSTGSRAARVTVKTTSGESFTSYVAAPKGSKDNPYSDADLDRKFLECVSAGRGAPSAAQLLASLREVSRTPDVRPLVTAIWHDAT